MQDKFKSDIPPLSAEKCKYNILLDPNNPWKNEGFKPPIYAYVYIYIHIDGL